MKVVPMGEVRNYFSKYLTGCADEPVFVTKNGRIAAVLEHIDDSQIEDFLLERAPRFRAMLRKAGKEKGGMSLQAYRASRKI
jgi:hypothetical protein